MHRGDHADVLSDREDRHRQQRGVKFRRVMSAGLGRALVSRPGISAEDGVESGALGGLGEIYEYLRAQRRRSAGCIIRIDMVALTGRKEVPEAELVRILVARFHLRPVLSSGSGSGSCRPY